MKRKTYNFGDLDSESERVDAMNDLENRVANEVEALGIELSHCVKTKKSKKGKGFAMNKVLMSIAVLSIVCGLMFTVVSAAYVKSDINYDIVSNPDTLTTFLDDVLNTGTFIYTPQAAPTGNDISEGLLYYDSTANALKVSTDGTTFTALDTATGVSLDGAYALGSKVLVVTDVIELEVTDGSNNVALLIDHDEATNDNDAMQITNAADAGTAVSIQIDGTAGFDIQGTGDVWQISYVGAFTTTGGFTITTADCLFNDTYDVSWDTSRDQLLFEDNAVLGIGGAHDAVGDVTLSHDGSDFSILSAIADEGMLIGGTAAGFDITYAFETAGQIRTDYDDDFLNLTDDMDLRFGTGASADGDFQISSSSGNVLTVGQVVSGTGEVYVGVDGKGLDVSLFAESASDLWLWDQSDEALEGTGVNLVMDDGSIALGDGDAILLGDALGTGDITISSTAAVLSIDGVVAETGSVLFGADDLGIDVQVFAATAGDHILWDASDEDLELVGVNLVLDADSAIENPVVVVTTGAYSVTLANSGKVHVIPDLAGNTVLTLPVEAAGLYYKFIYVGAAAEAHDHTIDSGADVNFFIGGVAFIDSDAGAGADELHLGVYSDGGSNSKLAINNMGIGTYVEIYCDGTNWYTSGLVLSDTIATWADQ